MTEYENRVLHGPKFGLHELESIETLHVGHADDLKIEEPGLRVWLCRCGVADGMPYENQVTVEVMSTLPGGEKEWSVHDAYSAG